MSHASINGTKNRFKLRLRYYDSSPSSPVFFEVKARVDNCILKERCGVVRDAAASGIDYGKDLAEKQILEKVIPRIAERLAARIGAETAEKWAGRLIPLASSAIAGALNFSFVRGWGRRVQRHLRAKHLEAKTSTPPPAFAAAFI